MKSNRLAAALAACVALLVAPAFAQEKKEAPKDIVLKGDARCTECHDENDSPKALSIGKTRHGVTADKHAPTCTSCHGESDEHVKKAGRGSEKAPAVGVNFGKKSQNTAQERNAACLSCHEKDSKRTHWSGSQHEARDVACTSCHKVHVKSDPVLNKATQTEVCYACHKTERGQTLRISTHPIAAGKMGCSDCHNPHGSTGPKLLLKSSISETCYTCHAEKRGPFLWEHASAADDCTNCHVPHGSTNAPLLKARTPFLCESCHNHSRHTDNLYTATGLPGGTVANINATAAGATNTNPLTGQAVTKNNPQAQLAYRACANCHSQIHGSNHPAGQFFLR